MLNKTILAVALMLASSAALAKDTLTESNLQLTWASQDSADLYALSGEYVADNNFFVGGGYAWGDSAYTDVNVFNINGGAYFPLARWTDNDRLFGKVTVGYSDVTTDWEDYSLVTARMGLVFESDNLRATAGVAAEFADIVDGYGVASYNIDGSLGWKFVPAWEVGTQFSLGDTDTYGAYVRYNFL